ncbi:hypothetical protein KASHIRA_02460 [Serratia phage vB_SmaM-Kashira]|nr:hypothetical protein [Acinetobacter phage ABPH49]URC22820.1 hypothetical protein KASHIRA_02460 [Serratia phage vB_SmaM-Kashira]
MKTSKIDEALILFLLCWAIIATWFAIPSGPRSDLLQSKEEIAAIMKASGYRDVTFGPEVKQMGKEWGPCLIFDARYEKSHVSGGYCTPKFMDWGVVITDYKVSDMEHKIEESYQK